VKMFLDIVRYHIIDVLHTYLGAQQCNWNHLPQSLEHFGSSREEWKLLCGLWHKICNTTQEWSV